MHIQQITYLALVNKFEHILNDNTEIDNTMMKQDRKRQQN